MTEIWHDIPGYEGEYQASNLGRIKSISRLIQRGINPYTSKEVILKQQTDRNGYRFVILHKKLCLVHRLIGMAFLPNPKETINHINGNKADNRIENLEWATRSENTRHAYDVLHRKGSLTGRRGTNSPNYGRRGSESKLSKAIVQMKDGKPIATFESMREAEREIGIHHAQISAACKGERPHAGGFQWGLAK